MNPANHWGSGIGKFNTLGLSTGIILGKAYFNFGDKFLLFIDALIATIFCNPSVVICSLFKANFTACLNKRQSACFFVIN